MQPSYTPSATQRAIITADPTGAHFLEGPAGTGKTTAAVAHLAHLLEQGVPGATITILVPQRTLAIPYYALLTSPETVAGGQPIITTLGGIARRSVDLFWPLVPEQAGFGRPLERPTFLSLETAQYFMARVVGPVIEERGYFDAVTIDRNRLYSQIIDNLNKAAVVGFSYEEIGERLKEAWTGDKAQFRMYDEVQESARLFRDYCKEHNLLDFSLQIETFRRYLWHMEPCRKFVTQAAAHIIADNIEEDTPAAHDLLRDLLKTSESALIVYDNEAGFRRFLGADPDDAYLVKADCDEQTAFTESFVTTPSLTAFAGHVAMSLERATALPDADPRLVLEYDDYRFHPQMIHGVAERIIQLVEGDGIPPGEIVVISPYLSDALRFSLMNRLEDAGVPVRSHRPSRALREEPATRCLLTLAQLAHPIWGMQPSGFDVVFALMSAIAEIDLGRAQMLTREVYQYPMLKPFDGVRTAIRDRVTYVLGERYDTLRTWLYDYASGAPLELDHFFSKLFGEVLSQVGFGFHDDFDAAEAAANLIDSARKFRQIIAESATPDDGQALAQQYITMMGQGIIADQYLGNWDMDDTDAVLVAPAYTFLMRNTPVAYQFWLNVGGQGWAERLYQPLTNPYVLTRSWARGRQWGDFDEVNVTHESLHHLVLGLVRRCRQGIYLGFSDLGEQGYEQRGTLLKAVQGMLRRLQLSDDDTDASNGGASA